MLYLGLAIAALAVIFFGTALVTPPAARWALIGPQEPGRGIVMTASTVIDRDTETTAPATGGRRPGRPGRGGNGPLERVTVNLVTRASRALQLAAELTGDSRTDIINRAIQVYAYVVQIEANGGAVYVRESKDKDSELQRLKML